MRIADRPLDVESSVSSVALVASMAPFTAAQSAEQAWADRAPSAQNCCVLFVAQIRLQTLDTHSRRHLGNQADQIAGRFSVGAARIPHEVMGPTPRSRLISPEVGWSDWSENTDTVTRSSR